MIAAPGGSFTAVGFALFERLTGANARAADHALLIYGVEPMPVGYNNLSRHGKGKQVEYKLITREKRPKKG